MNKYSIVLPVFNREEFLAEVIKSYQQQTYKDWEMIIVDDKSTDKSLIIATEFSQQDKRIKVVSHPVNSGVGKARRTGTDRAAGEYIVVADSDDFPRENRLSLINQHLTENPKIDVFYSNVELYELSSKTTVKRFFQPYNRELLSYINYIPNPAACYRHAAYNDIGGYDTSLQIAEDYDLWLSFAEKDSVFACSPEVTVRMTKHEHSVRIEKENVHKHYLRLVKQKHHCPEPNIARVKELATEGTYKFFTGQDRFDRWFSL